MMFYNPSASFFSRTWYSRLRLEWEGRGKRDSDSGKV
ncbi:hypothetical protein COLO4_24515 [Corchorus olitorius]|uniref:Uncharacterized protein n=1 Tax=Corchorus olitorius TaxID=93759 RepID=A0A1R3I9B5_9ROSI|nr:hypothetical protein COLO4_24515 [Corchorus olitorius]